MSTINSLREAFTEGLKDMYSAETQLVKALPEVEAKVSSPSLKKAIRGHLTETKGHVERLQEIAKTMNVKITGVTCEAMKGILTEGKEVLGTKSENEAVIDAMIIGSAQRVEHYEIAGYGTLIAMAEQLGESEVASILSETLEEEKEADSKLSEISVDEVLVAASDGEAPDSESDSEEEIDEDEDSEMTRTSQR